MAVYYNEINPNKAAVLRHLIAENFIAPGDVDTRPIQEVTADDLRGYAQCHFFAGFGGWSIALRLAMWPDDRPVWTGSCPCQPFSTAGKGKKQSDERHLWPHWARLIAESRPDTVFGEQVASAIAAGWLDEVCHDLEAQDYAVAPIVLPACSIGAPHKRDRLWFVAQSQNIDDRGDARAVRKENGRQERDMLSESGGASEVSPILADSFSERLSVRHEAGNGYAPATGIFERSEPIGVHAEDYGNFWETEPDVGRVADGIHSGIRKHMLEGFGDAIVPQVAAEFIRACGEIA